MRTQLRYLLVLCALWLPRLAFSSSESSGINFTPPDTDVSIKLLGYIFGVVDGVLHGGGSQLVGEMFGAFNAAVLVLGSIVIMYSVIISIVNTSNEGQLMGKQWSSVWVPIRSVAGIALLIPKATGYCAIQIAVMWIVVQGVGAADAVWGQALTYLQRGGVLIDSSVPQSIPGENLADQCNFYESVDNTLPIKSALNSLQSECRRSVAAISTTGTMAPDVADKKLAAANLLRALICMRSLEVILVNKRAELTLSESVSIPIVPNFLNHLNTIDTNGHVKEELLIPPEVVNSAGGGAYSEFAGVCGRLMIQPITRAEIDDVVAKFGDVPGIKLEDGSPNYNHPIISATSRARGIAVQQMIAELTSTATRIVNNVYFDEDAGLSKHYNELGYWLTVDSHKDWVANPSRTAWPLLSGYELVNAVNAYVALMRPTLRLLQDKMGDVDYIEGARAAGWILAGSYFYNIVKGTDDAQAAMFQVNSVRAEYTFNRTELTKENGQCRVGSGVSGPCKINFLRNGESVSTVLSPDDLQTSASPLGYCNYWSKPCGGGNDIVEKYIASAITSQETTAASQESGSALSFALPNVPKRSGNMFSCGFFLTDILNCVMHLLDDILFTPIINAVIALINWIVIPPFSAILFSPIEAAGYMFNASIKASYEPGKNPIIELAKFGNLLQTMSVNMIFGLLIWGILVVLIPVPLIGIPIFLILGPIVLVIAGALWSVGIILAFYVPIVPYVMFTFAGLAWLITVIEAMVAAPILALGLTHPEGQTEAFGRAESSVLILASVFLRPSLMILGFVLAIILSYVVVILFNAGFLRVNGMLLDISRGAGIGEFLAPIFALMLYVSMYMKLVEKCFDLIHILPDQVLSWIGGEREDIGSRTVQGVTDQMKQEINKIDSSSRKAGNALGRGVKKGAVIAARVGAAAVTSGGSETSGAGSALDSAASSGESDE
jgi:defect in organelle trafficking protein DotA